jgi:hypothetical protein
VAWQSSTRPTRHRFRVELWSWSTWLVLCIISYPAAVLLWLAPKAGIVSGLVAGLLLVFASSLGYAGRDDLEPPSRLVLLAGAASAAVGFTAVGADRLDAASATLCGLLAAAQVIFIRQLLPWLVRDAESADSLPAGGGPRLGRAMQRPTAVRASLSLALLLGFLALGLGAAWAGEEKRVPDPTIWLIALALLTLALMFLERMTTFERAAREGNLLMPMGSYRRWVGAGVAILAAAALLAAVSPWKPMRERADSSETSAAVTEAPPAFSLPAAGAREAASRGMDAARAFAAAALAVPRGILALWLLLLLLLLALIIIWGFRRSRAAKWLLRAAGWLVSAATRVWRRLRVLLAGLFIGRKAKVEAAPSPEEERRANPLFDLFGDPEFLAGMSAREVIVRTYHLALNFAEMLGHGRRRGDTPFEYASLLARAAPAAQESVVALTWAYAGAMYGGENAVLPAPSSVRSSWERISAALTAELSPEDLDLRRRAYLATRTLERSK